MKISLLFHLTPITLFNPPSRACLRIFFTDNVIFSDSNSQWVELPCLVSYSFYRCQFSISIMVPINMGVFVLQSISI